jgi:hypothetical protein
MVCRDGWTPTVDGLESYKVIMFRFLITGHLTTIWVFFYVFFFQPLLCS